LERSRYIGTDRVGAVEEAGHALRISDKNTSATILISNEFRDIKSGHDGVVGVVTK
jgi:hypothetical protein